LKVLKNGTQSRPTIYHCSTQLYQTACQEHAYHFSPTFLLIAAHWHPLRRCSPVLLACLLLSGDIELNPGPINFTLCTLSIVLGGVCRSTTAALRIHRLGPTWPKNRRQAAHHENDLFGKNISTVAFIYIKRVAAHRVILCNNVDLCLKMTLKLIPYNLPSHTIDYFDCVILQLEMSIEVG